MKLLQLLEAAATGAGRHVIDLSEGLLARGHEVHLVYSPLRCDRVFTDDIQRLTTQRNFHALPLPMERYPSAADIAVVAKLRRYVRARGSFDLVHCHSTKAGLVGRLGLAGQSVKRLYTPHGFFTMDPTRRVLARGAVGALEAVLSRFGHGVIAVSRLEYEHAVTLGIARSHLCLIPNGVALDRRGLSAAGRLALRRELGVGDTEVCIGFVGRLDPVKSPETMLDSFANHRQRSGAPSKLVMVGDGPLAAALHRRAANLGIQADIIWLGARDARVLMGAFDIFALTSDSEGAPLAVLEAMTRGLPIVATSVGSIAEAVQPGVNGFIAPVRGVAEIAAALDVLVNNPELRQRMGSASRTLAQSFSVDRMVEQTLAFYQEIVSGVFAGRTASAFKVAASG